MAQSHQFRCDDCGDELNGDSDEIIAEYNRHVILHTSPAKRAALDELKATTEQVNRDYAAATSQAELARNQGLARANLKYQTAIADEA